MKNVKFAPGVPLPKCIARMRPIDVTLSPMPLTPGDMWRVVSHTPEGVAYFEHIDKSGMIEGLSGESVDSLVCFLLNEGLRVVIDYQ